MMTFCVTIAEMAAHVPEVVEGDGKLERTEHVSRREQPGQRDARVGMLRIQPVEPGNLVGAMQRGRRLFSQCEETGGVSCLRQGSLAALG
jgi:hypothetical protein